jgi:hypothetical protein
MSDDPGRSTRSRGPSPLIVPYILPTATRTRHNSWFPNLTFAGTPISRPSSAGPSTSLFVPPEDPVQQTPHKAVVTTDNSTEETVIKTEEVDPS